MGVRYRLAPVPVRICNDIVQNIFKSHLLAFTAQYRCESPCKAEGIGGTFCCGLTAAKLILLPPFNHSGGLCAFANVHPRSNRFISETVRIDGLLEFISIFDRSRLINVGTIALPLSA